jgi:outer membrane lipoprotein LolB
MIHGRLAALAAAAVLLPACATLPVATDGLDYDQRRRALESVERWEMRGRLAVDTGERAFQGSFNWRQSSERLDLTVRGPLGNGVLRVTGTPRALTVTARGETRALTDPETELSALLGWWLPVGSLPAWLLGRADDGFRATTEIKPDGTLGALDQRLWRVTYPTYQLTSATGAASGVLIPRRIELAHGALELRLTIDEWRDTAADASSP